MREALPCVRCGKGLENVTDDVTNQPNDGLAFQSDGHYGSTAFDPMDGHYLEINVCDRCVGELAHAGLILLGRARKPVVTLDGPVGRTLVGWTRAHRELLRWDGATGADEDALVVEPEDVGTPDSGIDWLPGAKAD